MVGHDLADHLVLVRQLRVERFNLLGQRVTLASVRERTLPPSRYDSRSKMHGGELRLGTDAMYMLTLCSIRCQLSSGHSTIRQSLHAYSAQPRQDDKRLSNKTLGQQNP